MFVAHEVSCFEAPWNKEGTMGTASIHVGIRKMRFMDVYDRWNRGRLGQDEAAELLGVSVRSFQRWKTRFEADGEGGLADRRMGRRSPRRAPEEELERMLGLFRDKYADFTVKHFHEQLAKRHGYTLGYTITKRTLHTAGLVVSLRRDRPCDGLILPRT